MKVCTRSTCDGGIFTFEKTTAHFRRPGCEVALDLSCITSECAELRWEKGTDCPDFSLDYNGQSVMEPIEKICLRGVKL